MMKTVTSLVLATVLVGNCLIGISIGAKKQGTKYCGSDGFVQQSETITYVRKESDEYSIKGDLPSYTAQYGETTCANVAGAILVGYYDRFNENLIPNYKVYTQIGSLIKYKKLAMETSNVINELSQLMNTNTGGVGTTISGFQSGMSVYAQAHSSTYVAEDIGNLNFEKYQSSVKNEKPVVIFLSTFALKSNFRTENGSETIIVDYCSTAHVVAACGYKIDTYYSSSGGIVAQRKYLKVASGLNGYDIAYLCLDGKSSVDKAVAVQLL